MEEVKNIQVFEKYVIFKTGGKQYQAIPGKTVAIEKIEGKFGDPLNFPEVLFRKTAEGVFEFGQPFIKDASLKASIIKQMQAPKIVVFRHKRRKKQRTKKGHRQPMTVIRIESI
jgi:large subunit ribosomal protein L21